MNTVNEPQTNACKNENNEFFYFNVDTKTLIFGCEPDVQMCSFCGTFLLSVFLIDF